MRINRQAPQFRKKLIIRLLGVYPVNLIEKYAKLSFVYMNLNLGEDRIGSYGAFKKKEE
jgi:hypothetical protein